MAVQLSTTTRNRLRDDYVTAFPAGSVLVIRTGSPPGVANAATGTLLVSITLPATPFTNGTGQVTLNGVWSDTASGTGTVGYYRMTNGSDIEEGVVTVTGGGGDMTLDSATITSGQVVTIATFTRTMPGA